MFSKRLTNSARFLKMGAGAQALYFHLCMNADDDGVVEAFTVKRSIGANDDDLQNLIGRGFVKILDRDNEIVVITDWLEHNRLRADRITPSIYRNLIERAAPEFRLMEPKQRSDRQQKPTVIDVSAAQDDNGTDTGRTMDGHGTDMGPSHVGPRDNHGTGMGPLSIGEVSIGEVSASKEEKREERDGAGAPSRPSKGFMRPTIQEIQDYCKEKGYTLVDAEYFWNYYENIGWKVGKNKMKSWRLAVANWHKRQAEYHAGKPGPSIVQHTAEENAESWGFEL